MAAILEMKRETGFKAIIKGPRKIERSLRDPNLRETLLPCMVTKAKYLIFENGCSERLDS